MIDAIYRIVATYRNWSGETLGLCSQTDHSDLSELWKLQNKRERELCETTMREF
jgi:hypothetical protein